MDSDFGDSSDVDSTAHSSEVIDVVAALSWMALEDSSFGTVLSTSGVGRCWRRDAAAMLYLINQTARFKNASSWSPASSLLKIVLGEAETDMICFT